MIGLSLAKWKGGALSRLKPAKRSAKTGPYGMLMSDMPVGWGTPFGHAPLIPRILPIMGTAGRKRMSDVNVGHAVIVVLQAPNPFRNSKSAHTSPTGTGLQ